MINQLVENINYYQNTILEINPKAKILAVTKNTSTDLINLAVTHGINCLGENRVQEFLHKSNDYTCENIHFIGHLQSNKVKYIIDKVSCIQSVDSLKLASVINNLAKKQGKIMDILVQINISNEASKSGILEHDVMYFIEQLHQFEHLNHRGFMTIPEKSSILKREQDFDKMHEIFHNYPNLDILSMGMTNDFKLALKHGSNLIRIGSGLFKNC